MLSVIWTLCNSWVIENDIKLSIKAKNKQTTSFYIKTQRSKSSLNNGSTNLEYYENQRYSEPYQTSKKELYMRRGRLCIVPVPF